MQSKRGNQSKENLKSNARVAFTKFFTPLVINWEINSNPVSYSFNPYRDSDYDGPCIVNESYIYNFPFIYRSNNAPWDLGNLYLFWYYNYHTSKGDISIVTLRSIANALCAFLRFIEHEQNEGSKIHELYFPTEQAFRVTYRYRVYLYKAVRDQIVSLGTARLRINIIVNFYRALIEHNLVSENTINSPPFIEKSAEVRYLTGIGLSRTLKVLTTDLSFKQRGNKNYIYDGSIQDGEKLHPLREDEVEAIFSELKKFKNRTYELLFMFALYTGARMQTIGTLRIDHFLAAYEQQKNKPEMTLKVGVGTKIDTKFDKQYRLFIPIELAKQVIAYIQSPLARAARIKSFYGDSEQNYIFLNRDGGGFYTSRQELLDRQDPNYLEYINIRETAVLPVAYGQSIRNIVNRIVKKITKTTADFRTFRFHDLRATYGMNFVNWATDNGMKPQVILEQCKARMGHSSIETTQRYLDYKDGHIRAAYYNKEYVKRRYRFLDKGTS